MARQRRIQYPGALYHVLARGDRREAIVNDDDDRQAFVRTVGHMCERAGVLVHAYALLDNRYHRVLETPNPNLVEAMSWFQNTCTRRFNVAYGLWRRLFGGRCKSIAVDGTAESFSAVVDDVHLNPVRAGWVGWKAGLEPYPWCSLAAYPRSASGRAPWLRADRGLASHGLTDRVGDRKAYLAYLEQRVRQEGEERAGRIDRSRQAANTTVSHPPRCGIRRPMMREK